ncbi:MAG TPA: IS66 family transposase, partial [Myxococcaceae bacterium]|nr:IS66 family transposase [Myxococcaceae bacterium]
MTFADPKDARIAELEAQLAARDERLAEVVTQLRWALARIAELEAKLAQNSTN